MRAIWNNIVVAEASKEDLIHIEGNWYFPPESVNMEYMKPNSMNTTCFWKGKAHYYDIKIGGSVNEGSIERVGQDFTNFIAFWHGVKVGE